MSELNNWQLWGTALLSGFVGALVAPIFSKAMDWYRRPVLMTCESFENSEGVLIDRPYEHGMVVQWVRIKVENKGRSSAQGVRVILLDIEGSAPGHGTWACREQIVDCWWSHLEKVSKIDIPKKTHRYADLLVLRPDNDRTGQITYFPGPGGDEIKLKPATSLKLRVALTADNAETLIVRWTLNFLGPDLGFRKP